MRAREDQIEEYTRSLKTWQRHLVAAKRPGYSGVALLAKMAPDSIIAKLGKPKFDVEGRFQLARFGRLIVVNAYFPNGKGKERDNSRVGFKLDFYQRVFDLLERDKKRGLPILVMGDFDTAHTEIDLARPKQNLKISGFLPEERDEFERWLSPVGSTRSVAMKAVLVITPGGASGSACAKRTLVGGLTTFLLRPAQLHS